ncbi:Protein UmuD [Candidatus Jidaibacter acanthamoeba]|uniref:Protein UmuD n=1 Tax=Candidatus Jidaibacter acanthamoebae TaxID=86105 RepID=A0A0C1QM42_9RICK|nr:translesion error-prone DNA polymerase V autoproteolytic subunit [Candidatus Jidaibacter acanthamoeba]KIE05123.1 Protein UmuD [Candidatus Jidaibacter acanthamoeba]
MNVIWGGKREGSGRPRGAGSKYGEPTKPIRVPVTRIEEVLTILDRPPCRLPLYSSKVAAGFPSPADDNIENMLDLNEYLVKSPDSTYLVRATGLSMINAGIHPDDLLVVDRSLEPQHGKIVIAAIEGELTVKRLYKDKEKILLLPENSEFQPIDITDKESIVIWGVVTNVIHSY